MDDFKRVILCICVRFLKERGIYNIFIKNLGGKKDIGEYIINLFNISSLPTFIRNGFIWNDTDEGYSFWSKVNNDWVSYITSTSKINDLLQYNNT